MVKELVKVSIRFPIKTKFTHAFIFPNPAVLCSYHHSLRVHFAYQNLTPHPPYIYKYFHLHSIITHNTTFTHIYILQKKKTIMTATFIHCHTPLSSQNTIPTESCSTSDCSSSITSSSSLEKVYEEKELMLMLASKNPKKRAGRKKFRETRHPVYRGVRRRDSGKWVCEVRQPNNKTRVWLGTYATADMAARAHDVAVLAMRGRSACLNFADSVWRLPVPESGNVKDIQKAAVLAAEGCYLEEEEKNVVMENVRFDDEEVVFGMMGFFADMAEGLMLPPPRSGGNDIYNDDVGFCFEESLWSF
ncbi:hypothetical protein QVD17_23731 [Tagetes erecta]|uniref:AP2/ERF domain-containing protein n=1 Tax=Tagetes erecta TaxID=13708 RepID=A0AAD8KEE3_TARER|nr:hypothetical protein QVD17_23731 [Tagetes erecta]